MEFFNSLSKTLPKEYTKDGRGFEIVRFNETVAKAKKEDGQDASVFSCEYKWSISAKTERMFRIRRKLVQERCESGGV